MTTEERVRHRVAEPPSADGRRRLAAARRLKRRLDKPVGALGVLFLFIVLGQLFASPGPLSTALNIASWACWAVFVGEFVLRGYVAGFQKEFWRQNWWQVLFLLLPFLRFIRVVQVLRSARLIRVTGVLSAGVRGSRSAGRLLSSRLAWLGVITGIVILVSSQVLFLTNAYDSYALALHDAAMTAITGSPLSAHGTLPRVLEVVMAAYSIGVFATLAGSIGAFLLDPRKRS